ncbi:flippase [Halomonas sp. JS92-SW72]|uniref:flippase n=1 Tax=Halomonas sp. JS92-SW72 TaxID=2306583 RepID=UPI000E5AB79A|nr:flippase [Halomonas sp. JS92-SW72]AXY43692.1 flippase [Halomonas sp. JS92-SW72]
MREEASFSRGKVSKLTFSGDGLRKKLVCGSLASLGVKASYLALQFMVGVALARALGPEALGIYAFTMALVQLLAIIAQFGFPASLVRFVSVAEANGNYSETRGLLSGAAQIVVSVSFVIATGACLLLWLRGAGLAQAPSSALTVGLIIFPLLAFSATLGGATRGLGHVVLGQLPGQVVRPFVFLAVLVIISIGGISLTPESALATHAVSAAVAVAAGVALLLHKLPHKVRVSIPDMQRLKLARLSLPFLLLAGVQVLNYQTDILMLGLLTTQESVGRYRVALQIVEGLGVTMFAISMAIGPQIARLHAQQDWQRLRKMLVLSHQVATVVMLPLSLVVIIFAAPLLNYAFGPDFAPAAQALSILALGKVAYASVGFSGLALSMLGRPGVAAAVTAATFMMNISLNILLIPAFGMEGAAVATGASLFTVNALGLAWARHLTGYNFSAFSFWNFRSRVE